MKAFTYIEKGKFALIEKQKPELQESTDAIVRVTLGSICSSDLHIKHGSVPRAVPGITVGHEMVGVVEEIGADVKGVKVGDRVTVNVETFCSECFFCKHGYVNNCTSPHGGWALGCRIDGGQTEYVRVPLASQGLNRIPDAVTDEQALFVGDVLATGFWAARISEITADHTVLIIGAGPTGICTLLCAMLKQPNPGRYRSEYSCCKTHPGLYTCRSCGRGVRRPKSDGISHSVWLGKATPCASAIRQAPTKRVKPPLRRKARLATVPTYGEWRFFRPATLVPTPSDDTPENRSASRSRVQRRYPRRS